MKRTNINMLAAAAAIAFCMMTGCAASTDNTESDSAQTSASTATSAAAAGESGQASAETGELSYGLPATAKAVEDLFSDRDLEQTADTSSAKNITLADGETVNITEEGVYVVSGIAKDCTIKIDAGKEAKVQLVLDGAEITNSDFPAIYVVNADKVFVTTADGTENKLSVTGAFKADGETNTDAVIYSKDDITFNGKGTLTVSSAQGNGISGKDDVKFTGGTYDITSAEDAVEAKDSIAICGGTFTIKSDKDGFHSEDSDDAAKGGLDITGGTFNITAKSDGIQGTSYVRIEDGDITIDSSEGIEAAYIVINGGTINITASDDGINASSGDKGIQSDFGRFDATGVGIEINGGELTINMGGGDTDGVDSNGSLTITGGTINVNTSGNAFDYENEPVFTGGKIYVNGEEKTEVPQDMMGGFGKGGFGGKKPEGFDGKRPDFNGEMPEGFEPPEGFEGKEPPEGFDGKMPENFKGRGGREKSGKQTESTFDSSTVDA